MRLDFRSRCTVGPLLGELLEGLLEPIPEDRLTAAEALALLDGQPAVGASSAAGSGRRRGGWVGSRGRSGASGARLQGMQCYCQRCIACHPLLLLPYGASDPQPIILPVCSFQLRAKREVGPSAIAPQTAQPWRRRRPPRRPFGSCASLPARAWCSSAPPPS